jgi:disulfide bond formation protein DsbB
MVGAIEILAGLTFVSNVLLIYVLADIFFFKRGDKLTGFSRYLGKNAILFALLVSLTSTFGSLYFSDVLGFEPCKLCWYQRIFIYPQVLLFLTAGFAYGGRRTVFNFSLPLSVVGALFAGYHYILQIGFFNKDSVSCAIVGYSSSCSETFALTFGYITIPLMALTAFVMIIVLGWLSRKNL